jgi:hypothetical protein
LVGCGVLDLWTVVMRGDENGWKIAGMMN